MKSTRIYVGRNLTRAKAEAKAKRSRAGKAHGDYRGFTYNKKTGYAGML